MDPFVNEKDFELLTQDKYTFAVLDRILREDCDLIRTNHENLILCHSAARFPVWIWTPDGCPDTVKEKAWNLAAECRPLSDGYRFNMKYELADYFMKKAEQNGRKAGVHMQLFAYDCPSPAVPGILRGKSAGAHREKRVLFLERRGRQNSGLLLLPDQSKTCLPGKRFYAA